MSAPAALVNSTGVMLHTVSPPKRLMLASCRCPKHCKVSKSKRRLLRWGTFLAKWKRTAFFRKICDIEEKEEKGGPREGAQCSEQSSTTLRWAPMRQVRQELSL